MWAGSTSMSAMIAAPVRSCSSSIVVSSGSRSSIRSSPSITANGESPTWARARSTAWPRPLGSPWRTKWMSAMSLESMTRLRRASSPLSFSFTSSSGTESKWFEIAFLLRPMITRMSVMPACAASSTTYWIAGLSTTGSISLGIALVAGRNRVPRPAAGMTALKGLWGIGQLYRGHLGVPPPGIGLAPTGRAC